MPAPSGRRLPIASSSSSCGRKTSPNCIWGSPQSVGRFRKPPVLPAETAGDSTTTEAAPAKTASEESRAEAGEGVFRRHPPAGQKDEPIAFSSSCEKAARSLDNQLQYDAIVVGPRDRHGGRHRHVALLFPVAPPQQNQMMGGGFLSGFSKSPGQAVRSLAAGGHVQRRGRPGRRQGRPAGDRRVPEEPRRSSSGSAAACPRACC